MIYLLLGVVILYIFYSWITIKPKNFPPGPPTVPFLGSTPFLPRENVHFEMEKWNKKFGGVVGLVMGNQLAVAICSPKLVRDMLKREEFQGRPINKLLEQRSFNRRLGIMFADGKAWQEQRRFTVRHLKDFGFGKTSMEGIILAEIEEVIREVSNKKIQVSSLFNLSSVNVLWAIMAGIRYNHSDPHLQHLMNQLQRFFRSGKIFGNILGLFPFLRHVVPDRFNEQKVIVEDMQKFFIDIIKQHKEELDENDPRDFMDVYLTQMQVKGVDTSYDVENLITICLDLFSAGSESIGNTIGFALMYMVLYPEIQEKVQADIDSYIGRSRKPSLLDRTSLPYVEAVLLEIIRCNSIAPLTVPHRTTEDSTVNGYFIPKNSMLFLSLWSILQDKEHWGDPENFRPSRFIKDGKLIKDEYIIPFGIGKRLCPGEALAHNVIFLFFTSFLQEFSVQLPPGHKKPSTVCLSGFTTAPQPFEVIFKPR